MLVKGATGVPIYNLSFIIIGVLSKDISIPIIDIKISGGLIFNLSGMEYSDCGVCSSFVSGSP